MTERSAKDGVFGMLAPYVGGNMFSLSAREVAESGGLVLSCQRYSDESYQAIKALHSSGFSTLEVGSAYKVSMPGRFARVRVRDAAYGVPFLTGSSMQMVRPEKGDYISKVLTQELDSILLKEGTVVVTRSGTVGNTTYVNGDYKDCAGTDDLIRVDSVDDVYSNEYFYIFAISTLGRAMIAKDIYGGVIDHIEPDHVYAVMFPVVPKKLRQEIAALVRQSANARFNANKILDEANAAVRKDCNLPELVNLPRVGSLSEVGWGAAFTTRAAERLNMAKGFGQLRLDATFHESTAVALSKHILGRTEGKTLEDVLLGVRNSTLRKRTYVDDPEDGIPMLGGKQLVQWRTADVKFLSNVLTRNLSKELLQEGWSLVSCGGTLGRTLYVHRNVAGWAASQHVMRIMPNPEQIFPGFIYAYLSSEYGQCQIHQRSYGSVIPEIRDFQFNSIAIVIPADKGKRIHDLVVAAYDSRADARVLEDEAIRLFMTAIERGKAATEQEWGREY